MFLLHANFREHKESRQLVRAINKLQPELCESNFSQCTLGMPRHGKGRFKESKKLISYRLSALTMADEGLCIFEKFLLVRRPHDMIDSLGMLGCSWEIL